MQNLIYIKDLDYQVNSFRLFIADLQWTMDRVTTLSGPSGSGKTTFVRILLGLENGGPHFRWGLGQQDYTHLSPSQRNIGFSFQDYSLFPHLSCWDNIAFAAKAKLKTVDTDQLKKLIEQFSLQACQNTLAHYLSGGEQQRTALARAIATRPEFLILDEPFSALDIDRKQEAKQFVKDIISQYKIPTLIVTHDPADIDFFGSQQLIISSLNKISHIQLKR